MTSHRMRPALLAVALALAGTGAWAETLDFRQCVTQALAQNPDMAVAQAQIKQAEAAVREAKGNRLPRVNLSLTATNTNDALNAFGLKLSQRNATFNDFGAGDFLNAMNTGTDPLPIAPDKLNHPSPVTNVNSRIEVLIPVYNGGMVTQYVKQAQAYVRAAQAGDAMARQQLTKNVLMAYQAVHAARAYVEVAKEGVAAAEEYVRITDRLHQQGMAVKSDLLSAQVNLEDVKLRQTEAANAEAMALDQLHLLLGRPLTDALDVAEPVMPGLLAGDVQSLRAQALENHFGLRALQAQTEAATASVEANRAAKQPQLNVMLRQDWNSETVGLDAASYTVAGVLSWTAFDGGASQAAVDRAEQVRAERAAKLRQAGDGIAYQVGEARRRAIEAEDKATARALAVDQAREAQRLVKKRYENGMGTLIELLSAQAQLDKARADLVSARYDQAVQRAELKLAVGVLDAEQL
ncbi:TolC family protein [Parasulfuritortus cantonensis]|uniref:TolC family protein n=1 Tax=Parasulfuritortus cantonensis TaxID=2528202 RepID=A0A4R1B8X5_9PROT|nr:TolC family protein [Parasulfuritortus cantonensis]TCJ12883.1 TolC family protein [Parasulfuritortus cantonensis]